MIKYDNCKDCKAFCDNAGKDRTFICPNGKSCKVSAEPVGGFGGHEMINAALHLLDIQRSHCIEMGADSKHRYFSEAGGNKNQNTYYCGHLNMLEAMLLQMRKGVAINNDQQHYIINLED